MRQFLGYYKTYVLPHWPKLLAALLLTATLNQSGFGFALMGKWLVDDVLMVGRAAQASIEPADTEDVRESLDTPAGDDAREAPAPAEAPSFSGRSEAATSPEAPDASATTPDSPAPIAPPTPENLLDETPPSPQAIAATDAPTPEQQLRGLTLFLAISIGLHFGVAALGGIAGYLLQSTGQRVLFRLRVSLQRRLMSQSMAFYAREQTGHLMVRVLDDANALQANTVNLPVNFLTYIAMLIVGLTLMWQLSPTMTLMALGVLPLYAIGSALFMNKLRQNTEAIRNANAELQGLLEEKLTLIGTIKAYAQEPAEARRFFSQVRANLKLSWRQNALNTGLSVSLMTISGLGATAVLYFGFIQIQRGNMQLGAVLAFYGMTGQLFGPLTSLMNMHVVFKTTGIVLSRVYDVLDAQPDVPDAEQPIDLPKATGHIRFENVSLRYGESGPIAVRDLTFDIQPGQRVALLGSSGSGRTSVVYLLMRFYDPDTGVIRLDGHDLRQLKLAQLRSHIGLAAQEAKFFTGSIRDNIAFGDTDVPDEQIHQAAQLAGCHDAIMAMPKAYKTQVGKGGAQLDSLLVQRIAIARMLVTDPPVLIFDDSASTMTDDEELVLYEAIEHAFGDHTQLVITNRVKTAREMDRVLVMRDGRLIEQGTPDELAKARGTYWRMLIHQTQRPTEMPVERVRPTLDRFAGNDPPEQTFS